MNGYHFASGHIDEARELVRVFHYSHRWPSNVQVVGTLHRDGGLFGDMGEAIAACVFSIPPTRWSLPVWELSRLVRRDDVSVALSGLIAKTAKLCRTDLLVSFADRTHGHHGGIYQACSWKYDGCRDRRMGNYILDDPGGVMYIVGMEVDMLNQEEVAALAATAEYFGRRWKMELRFCWMNSDYPYGLESHAGVLQSLRNSEAFGPRGLIGYRLSRAASRAA